MKNARSAESGPGQALAVTPKATFDDLALAGGRPAFEVPLHVGQPNIGSRRDFLYRVEAVLDSGRLANNGPMLVEFESMVCDKLGVDHAVAMCNGTIALAVAMKALNLTGEVILPAFTFVAAAHTAHWLGLTPIFCDVRPDTHNIDPAAAEALITERTSAIIPVHLWGRPCDIDAVEDIARRHNLRVLYDASHALACSHRGIMVGNFGDVEVFSLHATKFVNSFEGGLAVTNDPSLARGLRLMRNFGFSGVDSVVVAGINGKMCEVSAAMGITSLEACDHFAAVNKSNYQVYKDLLGRIPGLSLIEYDGRESNNYQYIVVEIEEHTSTLSRDEIVEVLWREGVLARKYFTPGTHRVEPYLSNDSLGDRRLPNTEGLSDRVLCLPNGTAVSSEAIEQICGIIGIAVNHGGAVRAALSASTH